MASVIGAITDPLLGTDLQGKKASEYVLAAQQGATNAANARADAGLAEQKKEFQPWKDAGMAALSGMQDGSFMGKDPGYQFRLDQGNRAINAAASARGQAGGGATMKALTEYGQNYAANEYQNAFNRQNVLANYGNQASTNMANMIGGNAAQFGQNAIGMGNAQASSDIARANRTSNDIGQVISGAAAYFSDERLKTNIEPINKKDLAEMKSHLKAYHFNYISDEFGKGDWQGVMAQDLQKSKLGRTLVVKNENGHLQVNLAKVLSMFLATMGAPCR